MIKTIHQRALMKLALRINEWRTAVVQLIIV